MTKNSTVEQLFALVQEYLPARAQGSAPEVTGELLDRYGDDDEGLLALLARAGETDEFAAALAGATRALAARRAAERKAASERRQAALKAESTMCGARRRSAPLAKRAGAM